MADAQLRNRVRVTFKLNGRTVSGETQARTSLADFLRHEIGAYGTHVGCEHGICGACTVQVDGLAVRSCLMLAAQADGASVATIEGLGERGNLSILQQAMIDNHALQCGFCTPGILMSATQFLAENPHPDEREVRSMLSGHICRCTGYEPIVRAIMLAADAIIVYKNEHGKNALKSNDT